MASQKLLVVLVSVLILLTVTTQAASVHKRSASGSSYGYDNDLIEDSKQSRELEMKHDLKRLLEILLLDELEKNEDEKRAAPRPGR